MYANKVLEISNKYGKELEALSEKMREATQKNDFTTVLEIMKQTKEIIAREKEELSLVK